MLIERYLSFDVGFTHLGIQCMIICYLGQVSLDSVLWTYIICHDRYRLKGK